MGGNGANGDGLSLQTLVIASLSSLAAAVFVHEFWPGGATLGAAVTPIIVALVSEALRKPASVIARQRTAVNPPPVVTEREEDRFGIWQEQRPRRRLHVGVAVVTGVVAFAIAAFFLTGAELVLGGASDSDRFRVVPGKQRDTRERPEPERAPAPAPAPEEEEEKEQQETGTATAPPTETTAPTTPEEAPPETVPTPDPGGTAPTP